jgi:transposase
LVCPLQFPRVPTETAQAVGAAFGQANPMLAIGDQSQSLFSDLEIGHGCNSSKTAMRRFFQPALVTIFQYIEALPDRRAAEATRTRIEWKYALRLSLNHPGLDHTCLCEYRRWLLFDAACLEVFQEMLNRMHSSGIVGCSSASPWAADHLLLTVCNLSRVELLVLRMYQALDAVTTHHPEWLHQLGLLGWYGRYSRRLTQPLSSSPQDQLEIISDISSDISGLLDALGGIGESAAGVPALAPEMRSLRQAWSQNFELTRGGAKWRQQGCVSCVQGGTIER